MTVEIRAAHCATTSHTHGSSPPNSVQSPVLKPTALHDRFATELVQSRTRAQHNPNCQQHTGAPIPKSLNGQLHRSHLNHSTLRHLHRRSSPVELGTVAQSGSRDC